jgi:hypothetical protein
VAVHELTHAVHWQAGLDDGSPHRAFITAQTRYWLDFMFENPGAWRWLAYLLSHEAKQGGWAAADARRLAA